MHYVSEAMLVLVHGFLMPFGGAFIRRTSLFITMHELIHRAAYSRWSWSLFTLQSHVLIWWLRCQDFPIQSHYIDTEFAQLLWQRVCCLCARNEWLVYRPPTAHIVVAAADTCNFIPSSQHLPSPTQHSGSASSCCSTSSITMEWLHKMTTTPKHQWQFYPSCCIFHHLTLVIKHKRVPTAMSEY